MINREIYFLYANFAYKKTADAIASRLKVCPEIWNVFLFKINSESDFFEFIKKNSLENKIIFFCCGGKLLNLCIDLLKKEDISCLKFSVFPGIVLRSQVDAFLTRVRADYVLMNSAADCDYYKKLCALMGLPFNGIEYGPSWIPRNTDVHLSNNRKTAVFWEQFHVPASLNGKKKLLKYLICIANNNPDYSIYIKTRPLENYKGQRLIELMNYVDEIPGNLKMLDVADERVSNDAAITIAISSSAIMNGIYRKQVIFLLKNFSSKKYSGNFFAKSGLLRDARSINFAESPPVVNRRWLEENYLNPDEKIKNLLSAFSGEIKKVKKIEISRKKIFLILILMLFNNFQNIIEGAKGVFNACKYLQRE